MLHNYVFSSFKPQMEQQQVHPQKTCSPRSSGRQSTRFNRVVKHGPKNGDVVFRTAKTDKIKEIAGTRHGGTAAPAVAYFRNEYHYENIVIKWSIL